MDLKKLDELARINEPMPCGLKTYEQYYFQSVNHLYRRYDINAINDQDAITEKKKIEEAYNSNKIKQDEADIICINLSKIFEHVESYLNQV